jgi:hypothetical protein
MKPSYIMWRKNPEGELISEPPRCWAFCKDPSKLPQVVFLTLTEPEPNLLTTQVHFIIPQEAIKGHVFKILIHLDVVEYLMFYHYPRELLADGKVPWREFPWQYGQPDGDDLSDDLQPPTRFCTPSEEGWWRRCDDDEGDRTLGTAPHLLFPGLGPAMQ